MKYIRPLARSLFLCALCVLCHRNAAAERPNVLFILADDLGWADTTLYGHTEFYRTPNIERLARRGLAFTRAYSASPLCSPTRSAVLTGLSPARTGITAPNCHLPKVELAARTGGKAAPNAKAIIPVAATRLNPKYRTLAEALKDAGYATGHFGKWHLGPEPYSPLQQGFDMDVPHWPGPGPAGSYVAPWKFKDFDPDPDVPDQHIEDRMAKEAVAFMEKHKDRPFFLNYWMFSVHAPFDAKKALIDKYRDRAHPADPQRSPTYAAMIESMDDAVGTLLDTLDRLKLTENTIIIFASDNGGNMYNEVDGTTPTSNAPLRGGKATMFEGGTRVPCVIAWPGRTQPGTRSDALIQSEDFYPTLLDGLALKPAPGQRFDGVSILPALQGQVLDREAVFQYFPHSPGVPDWLPPAVSVHRGDWKLIRIFHGGDNGAHRHLLFNLRDDLGEKNNLASQEPELVAELDGLIATFLADTEAVVPVPNPTFDPAQYRPEDEGKSKRKAKLEKKASTAGDDRESKAAVVKPAPQVGMAPGDGDEVKTKSKPNIIYIMADELAYYEPGFMGGRDLHTPNMDQLAAGGVIFRNMLSGGPNCAPARGALLTGKHSGHGSVRENAGDNSIRADEETIGSVLKKEGYATGGFGKWGIGGRDSEGVPEKHGFDVFFGYYDQVHAHTYYPPYLIRNSEEVPLPGNNGGRSGQTYSHYLIHAAALKFIREHAGKEPFFAYLPYTPPHGPYAIPNDDPANAPYRDKPWPKDALLYAAMTTMLDRQIGDVLDLLKELGIEKNTLVFFCGDNGGQDRFADAGHPRGLFSGNKDPNSPTEFRGSKGGPYEGAFRVSFAASWPGKIAPGRVSEHLGYFPDVLPTIAEVAGAAVPNEVDGLSFLPELIGEQAAGRKQEQHDYLYWERNSWVALRCDNWRAVNVRKTGTWELYDLATDPGESKNVTPQNPAMLARLQALAAQAHEPMRPGTYTTRERADRDRRAKFGRHDEQEPPRKKANAKPEAER